MKVFCGLICAVQATAVGGAKVSALKIGHFLPAAFAYQTVCPVGVLTNTPLPPMSNNIFCTGVLSSRLGHTRLTGRRRLPASFASLGMSFQCLE